MNIKNLLAITLLCALAPLKSMENKNSVIHNFTKAIQKNNPRTVIHLIETNELLGHNNQVHINYIKQAAIIDTELYYPNPYEHFYAELYKKMFDSIQSLKHNILFSTTSSHEIKRTINILHNLISRTYFEVRKQERKEGKI